MKLRYHSKCAVANSNQNEGYGNLQTKQQWFELDANEALQVLAIRVHRLLEQLCRKSFHHLGEAVSFCRPMVPRKTYRALRSLNRCSGVGRHSPSSATFSLLCFALLEEVKEVFQLDGYDNNDGECHHQSDSDELEVVNLEVV